METLLKLDQDFFLWLNSMHCPEMDGIMYWITLRQSWFPFYLLFVLYLIFKFKKAAIFQILIILLAVALSDQLCSSILKPLIGRLRPCHEIGNLVHLVGDCGGQFGFCSSHAANSFALATCIHLLFRNKTISIVIFIWAFLLSYSRIYVGAHYPLDILAGSLIGIGFSYFSYFLVNFFKEKIIL